jgi:hypothetical protein
MRSPSLRRPLAGASLLALTFACSGPSDPLATDGARAEEDVAAPGPLPSLDAADRAGVLAPNQEEVDRVAHQIPGRDLSQNPPKVESTSVVPQPGGADPHLEVTFGEAMPSTVKILVEGSIQELRDDGRGEDRVSGDGVYTARAPADWARAPEGREAAELAGIREAPGISVRSGSLPHVPWSLIITDLAVVNDDSRISDPCSRLVTPSISTKEWAFGYLMNNIANTGITNVSSDTFVRTWLSGWITPTTINGDPVRPPVLEPSNFGWDSPDNVPVPKYLLEKWKLASRVRSDGTLDPNTNPTLKMEKAPFRLLGIVFRPDLRRNGFFGEGTAGELRFVFGALNLDPYHDVPGWGLATNRNLAQNPQSAGWGRPCDHLDGPMFGGDFANTTVILEYAVDKATQTDVINWAKSLSNLSNLGGPSNSNYRNTLQNLTETVVKAGVGKGKQRANESALIRIRTNEAVSGGGPWHLREFGITALRDSSGRLRYQNGKLVCTSGSTQYCVPRPQTVKQTPAAAFNATKTLTEFVNRNESAILNDTYVLPASFNASYGTVQLLGGRAINAGGSQTFWEVPLVDNELRHKLSLNTCNGCHSAETGTHFAHIMSRKWDEEAPLSGFLSGYLQVADPITGELRTFSEPDNRALDLMGLATSSPSSLMSFQPTTRTH